MVNPSMHPSLQSATITNVRISHKTAQLPLLEAVSFKDKREELNNIKTIENIIECIILQTCNRIELYIVSQNSQNLEQITKQYFINRAGKMSEEA
ncbi:MAG: hypothetical protein GX638_04250, partial [Crenarchaeota archaeon]|nr:hypothetical protein [Thermoproteota archaeon]